MSVFKPCYFFNGYEEIDVEWLKNNNIKYILSDLDGTLAAWNENGDESLKKWINELKQNGVELIIVSNNNSKRVDSFAKMYSLIGCSNCKKPLSGKISSQEFFKKIKKDEALFLGDQLFTDIWCGKRLGVRTAIVKPLGDYEPKRTRCKRGVEKVFLGNW